jgi:hypothetical protein
MPVLRRNRNARSGSKASDRRARRVRGMSAAPLIATELVTPLPRRAVRARSTHDARRSWSIFKQKPNRAFSTPNVTYSVFWIPSDCSSQCNKLNMYVLFREISWISSRGMRPCL